MERGAGNRERFERYVERRAAAGVPVEWILIEWPKGAPEPSHYGLSTVPEEAGLSDLVSLAEIRWRIERDDPELEDELGLDHCEGRGWRGFRHHGTLCVAAYCFRAAERGRPAPLPPHPRGQRQTADHL